MDAKTGYVTITQPIQRVVDLLATEFVNHRPSLNGRLQRTFVLRRDTSDQFPLGRSDDGGLCLGIPDEYFAVLSEIPWKRVVVVPGQSGLYLVFKPLLGEKGTEAAIKLQIRRSETMAISNASDTKLRVVPYTELVGDDESDSTFPLKIVRAQKLDWEKCE